MKEALKISNRIESVLSRNLAPVGWQRYPGPGSERIGFGCCYPAAEALYHLWGKKHGFKPYKAEVNTKDRGWVTHYFLKHRNGTILDPTANQFPAHISYASSQPEPFVPAKPSKLCLEIFRRMKVRLRSETGAGL